jgi:hypothetical protein
LVCEVGDEAVGVVVVLLVKGGEVAEVRPVTIGLVSHVITNPTNERKLEANSSNSSWFMDDVIRKNNNRYPVDIVPISSLAIVYCNTCDIVQVYSHCEIKRCNGKW